MDYTEKWGVDIEEAVRLALLDLKCSRDEVEVTVLEEPTKGFLGIGAKLAKVRVEKIKPVVEEKKPEPKAEKKEPKHKERKSKEKKTHEKKSQDSKEDKTVNLALDDVDKDSLKDVEDHEALTFLKDITEKMGLNLNFNAKAGDGIVYLEMNGQDSRTVIGKRGQTLDALQYLTSIVINAENSDYIRVKVDTENYRYRRKQTLENLAENLASKVKRTGKAVTLEPMNAYELSLIHI